jgi:hypothetical protein
MIKESVTTVCDLRPDEAATDTIEFGLDGKAYIIDLSEGPAKELRDLLQRYIDAGRRKQANPASTDKPARGEVSAAAKAKRERLQTIRDWARTRPEFAALISDRGRVRKEIQDAWEKDQQQGHPATEEPVADPQVAEQPSEHHNERVPAFSS